MTMPAAKKRARRTRSVSVPEVASSGEASLSIRKIANGYIISESRTVRGKYTHTERFSPTKPKIEIG